MTGAFRPSWTRLQAVILTASGGGRWQNSSIRLRRIRHRRCPFPDIHVGAAVGHPCPIQTPDRYPRADRMAACTPVPWMAQKGVPAADVLRAGLYLLVICGDNSEFLTRYAGDHYVLLYVRCALRHDYRLRTGCSKVRGWSRMDLPQHCDNLILKTRPRSRFMCQEAHFHRKQESRRWARNITWLRYILLDVRTVCN